MIGLGNDIIEIERIRRAYERYGSIFLKKVFQPVESSYCFQNPNPFPSLAVRFAAKEAVAKAFRVGIGPELNWKSVTIYTGSRGEPLVQLDALGTALLQHLGGTQVWVALSHTRTLAQAVAFIE